MMLPSNLRQKVKIHAELNAFMELVRLIQHSPYIRLEEAGMPLVRFLSLSHIHNLQQDIYLKVYLSNKQGKSEMSYTLSIPELLSLWQLVACTPAPPGSEAQQLIDQVDKHATDIAYLIDYRKPLLP